MPSLCEPWSTVSSTTSKSSSSKATATASKTEPRRSCYQTATNQPRSLNRPKPRSLHPGLTRLAPSRLWRLGRLRKATPTTTSRRFNHEGIVAACPRSRARCICAAGYPPTVTDEDDRLEPSALTATTSTVIGVRSTLTLTDQVPSESTATGAPLTVTLVPGVAVPVI
jgi:hypothetical protein